MVELLPCPFCGGKAARQDNGPTKEQLAAGLAWGQDFDDGGSFIECTRCNASTALHFERRENLTSDWNRRAPAAGPLEEIAAERRRQIEVEGWTPKHDDIQERGEMARAAASYAGRAAVRDGCRADLGDWPPIGWPWSARWWKPTTPRRDLVKAGALIVAEIERLDRAAAISSKSEV